MSASIPTGTVTFLFTDIEDSTRLAQAHPSAWEHACHRHHVILREAAEAHQGNIFQVIGDSLCVAFPTAPKGLQAAIAAQQQLHAEAWGETPIRVRMGIHTGAAEFHEGEYHGYLTLAHAQRVMSTAYGGQTLTSNATAGLLSGHLPTDVTLRDMGEHRLKGILNPERLWQVVAPDLPKDFPPLQSLDTIPNNLPIQVTSFVGREREISELQRLLSKTRLLTLTGSGGTGKTRLSLQVAAEVLDEYKDGVWFVELAPLADPSLVPQTVANVLGIRDEPGRPLLTTLVEWLRPKQLLLILDNCEHLIEACAKLADAVLHAGHETRIFASSREALGIAGETAYRVPSLECPTVAQAMHETVEQLTQYAAVQLFIDRATNAQTTFRVTNGNAPAIAQICFRLDGIPLAIELATARVRAMPVETIAARLDDRFRLLTGGSRTALPRQQTLRGTIDWSYSLLSELERSLLRRLSVFAGGWTMAAAEAVCGDDAGADPVVAGRDGRHPPLPRADILDLLTRLVDKSLVVLDEEAAEPRYRMLETIRQYAREKLLDANESELVRDRHLRYYLDLGEKAEPELSDARQTQTLYRLELEHDNLRAAIEWAVERADTLAGLRLTSALRMFWFLRGHVTEGVERTMRALAQAEAVPTTPELDRARGWALEGAAWSLWFVQSHYAESKPLVERALDIGRALPDRRLIARALHDLGGILIRLGDYAAAQVHLEQSITIARELEDDTTHAMALSECGDACVLQSDYLRARPFYEGALAISEKVNDLNILGYQTRFLGYLELIAGEFDRASEYARRSLLANQQIGDRQAVAACFVLFGAIALGRSQPQRACTLLAAAEVTLESIPARLLTLDGAEQERTLALLRTQVSASDLDAAWVEGRTLTLDQAIALALQPVVPTSEPTEAHTSQNPADASGLTARERDVLRLLAEGLSNPQIAERLVVSAFTVRAHLRAIYGKLGVNTRSAATRYALEHHLV